MDIPPDKIENLFNFTEDGYIGPDFSSSKDIAMSDIKAAIIGMELERDYLKSCEEYVVGFNQNAIQILRHNCIYGGIRDLSAAISVLAHIVDLPAYIKQTYAAQVDIASVLKGFTRSHTDISETVRGWAPGFKDLPSYIKQIFAANEDISAYVNIFYAQQEDLNNSVRGWSTGNVIDIINTIRIWHEDDTDIPAYLKSTVQQEEDLLTIVQKIWQHTNKDIDVALHGWQEVQLQKLIRAFHVFDLPIQIRSTYFINLGGWLYAIPPVDIQANLMAWDSSDLPVLIAQGTYDGDLPTNIFGVGPKDLGIKIYVKRGIEVIKDLHVQLTTLFVSDLTASLNTIQYFDLNAYLNSSRYFSDLQIKIYPKLVNIKHHINISFLEHRDLAAIVNFPCFSSSFRDLAFSLVVKNSKDLKFFVYGYDYSNILDLRCSINASSFIVTDSINVKYFNSKQPETTTTLRYENKEPIYSFNTINTWTNTFTRSVSDLAATIRGNYLTKDLPVFIRAYSNLHYKTNNLQEKFIALKLKNNQEDFRRHVELTFNSYANQYTYFSGNKKAYRDFENDHWVVRVEGHELLPVGSGFEKTKVRRKYIFNLRNYESFDDAIKDMVDRVTNMKSTDLGAFIESTNDRRLDLGVSIKAKRIFKSNRVLRGILKPAHLAASDLPLVIIPTLNKGAINLTNSITPVESTQELGVVDFDFLGSGDQIPDAEDADFLFDLEEDDGNN